MTINSESLRFILGIKVKQYRQAAGLSLKQLAQRTELSISYLSEIEKGKKYPKPEKIILLADALGKSYDDLVSMQLDEELNPITALLDSPLFKDFPLQQFGIGLSDLFDLVTDSPSKAGAFVRTLLEIGRGYDMQVEHFLLAALRSYQKMHLNYFAELEQQAQQFRADHQFSAEQKLDLNWLTERLNNDYRCAVEYDDFESRPELNGLRSICVSPRLLVVNQRLSNQQRQFLLAKELGFRYLAMAERSMTSSWIKVESFEQVFNNFKASYFASALLIPEAPLIEDLRAWLAQPRFDGNALVNLMQRYDATPEMFLYRMSQLMPHHFGLHQMHYMRLHNPADSRRYNIAKELNTTNVFSPRGFGPNEHHCRRWVAMKLLEEVSDRQRSGETPQLLVAAQRSRFIHQDQTFFNFAVVRPLSLEQNSNTAMALGFLIDDRFRELAAFWRDADVPEMDVHESCERCPLTDCDSRAAEPTLLLDRQHQHDREVALQDYLDQYA
ncbi:helix-turn-helix domain-containing protein [Saccharospirillum sp. HFRX-1]|uniref:helix-turn-helix domain-containing protein n=1 Tax=unclassified Saccharospirillum TaxID=2633430 RepID=UPI00371AC5BE